MINLVFWALKPPCFPCVPCPKIFPRLLAASFHSCFNSFGQQANALMDIVRDGGKHSGILLLLSAHCPHGSDSERSPCSELLLPWTFFSENIPSFKTRLHPKKHKKLSSWLRQTPDSRPKPLRGDFSNGTGIFETMTVRLGRGPKRPGIAFAPNMHPLSKMTICIRVGRLWGRHR